MKLFLGMDGGQSSTTALIGDATGRVVGMGHAGPSNYAGAGAEQSRAAFAAAVEESVRVALERAGVSRSTGALAAGIVFESACCGFSGGAADKEALTRGLVKAARYLITHDAWIALAGAIAGEPGAIAIAGTGSIAFGRNGDGRTARAGGWGYAFGDEGGAFDLVRQAVRAVLRHEEGWGPPTLLRELLLEATASTEANGLLHRCYTEEFPRRRVAALAPLVDRAASAGDPIAQDILKSAAQALATLLAAVRGQLFLPLETVALSYGGGAFRSRPLRERFRMLLELDAANRVAPPRYSPAAGALLEAYRIAGVACTLKDLPEEQDVPEE